MTYITHGRDKDKIPQTGRNDKYKGKSIETQKIAGKVDLFDYNGAWEVEGKIFADHKIKSIYFIDMDDAPIQGYMDTWSFTLNARSIKPVEYFLNKK